MPGIFFLYKKNPDLKVSLNTIFQRVRNIINITGLEYTEFFSINHNTILHNIYPAFIDEKRFIENDEFIAAMDGDYYNLFELNHSHNRSYNKMEMILFLYSKYHDEAGSYLNGEFVILIHNKKNNETIVVNDRYARRPIFYHRDENLLIISSEKKSIYATDLINKKIDKLGVLQVFTYRHNLEDRTFLRNIKTLPPASVIIADNHKFDVKQYFKWKYRPTRRTSKKNLLKEFYNLTLNATEIRIKNKQRVLLWLSGGLDSRSIAGAVNRIKRLDITNLTYGEQSSFELEIANEIAQKLNLAWNRERVEGRYSDVAKVGAWKSEFSIPALEHAFISSHHSIKKNADYILSGLPGNATLIGKVLSPNSFIMSILPNFLQNFVNKKTTSKEELEEFFNSDFLNQYYPMMIASFERAFIKIDATNKLDKISLFNQLERQPHYSYMSDLVENDIAETLHPFCDTNLIDFFLKVPLRYRLFDQLARNMMYEYFPELRSIPLDGNRGKLVHNDNFLKYIYRKVMAKYFKKEKKSQNWNRGQAIIDDWKNIKNDVVNILKNNDELKEILNIDKILNNMETPHYYSKIPYSFDLLITFLYSYHFFIEKEEIMIPDEVNSHFSKV